MRNCIRYFALLVAALQISLASASDADDFFRAVRNDNVSAVRSLLQKGFDVNMRDPQGQIGLLLAMREPSPRVVEALIAAPQTDVDALNPAGESPLMIAAFKGQQDVVNKLLARDAAVNKTGWTPLHYAATNGHLAIMRVLLEQFAFIDAQSPNGTTPLMMAAMYGSSDAVKLLLDEGADIHMKNEQGMTALDFAKRGQRPDAVELLTAAERRTPTLAPIKTDGKW